MNFLEAESIEITRAAVATARKSVMMYSIGKGSIGDAAPGAQDLLSGASTTDLAVILVDARKGLLTQTRRHSRIAALMGVRHGVLAVNKVDLVAFSEPVYGAIVEDYRRFAASLGLNGIATVNFSTSAPLVYEPYAVNRVLG